MRNAGAATEQRIEAQARVQTVNALLCEAETGGAMAETVREAEVCMCMCQGNRREPGTYGHVPDDGGFRHGWCSELGGAGGDDDGKPALRAALVVLSVWLFWGPAWDG